MPQEHLLWHYRSRHVSLIAFSNAKFYDNKLLTFPSSSDQISEVNWVNVPGVYDKGKTKQNRAKAEAIIAEVERRLSDENLRRDSIGIVTFSSVQQNPICLFRYIMTYPKIVSSLSFNVPFFASGSASH